MNLKTFHLNKLTHKNVSHEIDHGCYVCHVKNPAALVQAAGYMKHVLGKQNKTVYLRGQYQLFNTLPPALYRKEGGIISIASQSKRDKALDSLLKRVKLPKKLIGVPEYAREPLLQHYGVRTRWLDVVDNLWIALWFACHNVIQNNVYIHFEKREVRHAKMKFAYILLLQSCNKNDEGKPGVYTDHESATVDLRIAIPSQFVRPHAQYGLVIQALNNSGRVKRDFSDLVVGILRIELADALEWLGDGRLINVRALFPPATYDQGYQYVLEDVTDVDSVLGGIHLIGP